MVKKVMYVSAFLATAAAVPAAAQAPTQRISIEPYVGYEFFGSLPDSNPVGDASLQSTLSYGARLGYQLGAQWSLFGNFQRSNPEVENASITVPGFSVSQGRSLNVDRWAAGVEFSYVPRGGAEGMLPIQLEAGLGQTRYENGPNDLTVKLGVSSALQLSPNLAIRYGIDDHISNFDGDRGVVNQFQARIGAELRF